MGMTIIGVILILLQVVAYIGNILTGGVQFFSTFSIFELIYFIGYNLIGIIGVISLILGIRSLKTKTPEAHKDEASEQQPLFEEVESVTEKKEDRTQETTEQSKVERFMGLITSKHIAAVISILLCITLYLSFLSAFTTKKDTYICYTTKTGECFHSATCNYLNTAYETTVYEASQKYKACKYCNPCVEQYKTTITIRNYVIPILISVPISATVFLLLTYRKKK